MLKCLENMILREEDEKEKEKISNVLRKLDRSREKK
jgi:hypothetical protein